MTLGARRFGALLRRQGTWWLVAALVLIWGAAVLHIREERAFALATARAEGINLARAFSEALLRSIREIDQTLLFVRTLKEMGGEAIAGPSADPRPWIERLLPDHAETALIFLAGRDGVIRLSQLEAPPDRAVVADRPYFHRFAEHPDDDGLVITPPVLGRISGEWRVQFVRMLRDPSGRFDGVVGASVSPAALLRFAAPVDLGKNGDISLIGLDGVLRARVIEGSPVVQSGHLSASPAVQLAATATVGSFTWRDPLDHAARLYGFARVPGLPLAISVGLLRNAVLAEYRADMPRLLAAAAGASLLLIGLALFGERARRDRAGLQAALERTLANISQGVVMADPEGRVVVMNRRARELLELPPGLGAGSTMRNVIAWQAAQGEFGDAPPPPWPGADAPTRHTRPNGTVLERRTHLLADGSAVRTLTDVTAWERAQQALRDARETAESASRARTQFLAVMSHEIRTPLNGVLGVADLLHDAGLTAEQHAYVSTIRTSGRHLLALLNDVLDFATIDSGALELEHVAYAPRAVLETVRTLLAPQLEERGLPLRVEVTPDVPARVVGDPQRLRQVLMNLIGNAVKFTPAGAVSVRLDATPTLAGWRLVGEVRDTGIGIAAATLHRLFQEFTQADGSITRRFGGTGLGLVISRRLLEAMGGGIVAESEPGRGSVFHFHLAVQRPAPEVPDLAAPDTPSNPLSVLLAEDNAVNRLVATRFLERLGHSVHAVGDGTEAVAAMRAATFDLVLMDLMMPVMDGLAATRAIRALPGAPGRVKIIGISASASSDDEAACQHAGMDGFAPKPITLNRLAGEIARVSGLDAPAAAPILPVAPSPLDPAVLETLLAMLGADALGEIVAAFRSDAPARMGRMREHAAGGSAQWLVREAHALAGSAATLGLHPLAAAARLMESRAGGNVAKLRDLLAAVEREIGPALASLDAYAALCAA